MSVSYESESSVIEYNDSESSVSESSVVEPSVS